MFTGIVEELGSLVSRDDGRLRFAADVVLKDVTLGASIAVNGCCLTVVDSGPGWFEADVVDESFARTSLGTMSPDDPVNLERPVRADGRLDGHIVQGHVDGVGKVVAQAPAMQIAADPELLRYLVEKGSITVDGVSLTVVSVTDSTFEIAVIPHTSEVTTLGVRRLGDQVNLEVDIIAKYVERLTLPHREAASSGRGEQ